MKFCVIGTGSIGKRHIKNLIGLGYKNIIAVSEFSKKNSLLISDLEIKVYHSFETAIKTEKITHVFIANPSSMHEQFLETSLNYNFHVYLEKPVCLDSSDLLDTYKKFEQSKGSVFVGNQFRYNHILIKIKEMIENNSIGEIIRVNAHLGEHVADYHPNEDFRNSYAAKKDLGGGILLTQVHQINYINWLFGNITSLSAFEVPTKILNLEVEENISYTAVTNRNILISANLNFLERPKRVSLEIIGTQNSIYWDYFENTLKIIDNEKCIDIFKSEQTRDQMFQDCLKNYINSSNKKELPKTSFEDGIYDLKVIRAIRNSIQNKKMINVEAHKE